MDDRGHPPSELAPETARSRAGEVSSQILDMIGIKTGKVTEPGPGITPCTADPDHHYRTQHPWSVYGVSEDVLKAGFQRLRESLPKRHWKIVDYGPNSSRAKTLELTADHDKDPFSVFSLFSVNAELRVSGPAAGTEKNPLILVHVVSGCFRAPEGTALDQEY